MSFAMSVRLHASPAAWQSPQLSGLITAYRPKDLWLMK